MWRILTVCLVTVSLVVAGQDGAERQRKVQEKIILLEVEPNANSNGKDKRSPQHGSRQVVFGASPGQFIVRTSNPSEGAQDEVSPEHLSLLEQLAVQQQDEVQPPTQPVLQQLLIARNPDPSAVQFSGTPGQAPPRRRPPPSPQAQLQQLYFNQQFQQQIPLRPRILRPIPSPAVPRVEDFRPLTTSSEAHNVHEARLRASLAGNDPNLAVQALRQQQDSLAGTYDQQLLQLATAAQGRLVQAQALPQQTDQVQYVPQQLTAHTFGSQVRYVPEPQRLSQRPDLYTSRQAAEPQQLVPTEDVNVLRRPSPPQQYLRETTQPIPERTVVQNLQRQQNPEPNILLSSQSGQQTPSISQDDIISQFLSQGHSLFHSRTPSPAVFAQDSIKSSTSLPPTESRSSIHVTQTSNLRNSQGPSKITVEEIGQNQEDTGTTLPVVHLPTPKGQRPLSQSELQALIDAGFRISPVPENYPQTVAPEYYQPTTKKQRSYVTPTPPQINQLSYEAKEDKSGQETANDERVRNAGSQRLQQNGQAGRHRQQGTNSQQEEGAIVQYIRRPENQNIRQGVQVAGNQLETNKPESEAQIISYIQIPTAPQIPDINERTILTKYQPEAQRGPFLTHLQQLQDQRESLRQELQSRRYQTQAQTQNYQAEAEDLPQQTPTYQQAEETVTQQPPKFHPIVVAEFPSTPTPRIRGPRPIQSKPEHQEQSESDQARSEEQTPQYIVAVDSFPQPTSFGTRNSRLRGRRPIPNVES